MAKTKKAPKTKQGHLPGMEPPRIKAIDDAAETYFDAVQERLPLTKAEDEAKDHLIEVMHKHQMTRYETADGLVVDLTNKSNVKVKRKKDVSANGEEEGGGDGEE